MVPVRCTDCHVSIAFTYVSLLVKSTTARSLHLVGGRALMSVASLSVCRLGLVQYCLTKHGPRHGASSCCGIMTVCCMPEIRSWTLVPTGRSPTRCLFTSARWQKVESMRGLKPSLEPIVAPICSSSTRRVVCACRTSTLGTFGALLDAFLAWGQVVAHTTSPHPRTDKSLPCYQSLLAVWAPMSQVLCPGIHKAGNNDG